MNREDEILEELRAIREAQIAHHREWQAKVQEADEYQRVAARQAAKAARSMWAPVIIVVLLLAMQYVPGLLMPWRAKGLPGELCDALFSPPIATPAYDGEYVLDAEQSFGGLDGQGGPNADSAALVNMLAERYDDFTVDHGVIRSGKGLRQEFRIVSGDMVGDTLVGRAVWHEDVDDPGDCCVVNVCLRLTGDVLELWFFDEGGEQGKPVVLKRR